MENKGTTQFERQLLQMYLTPNRVPLTLCYSMLKKNYERLGWRPVPSLSSMRRKVRLLPPEVISIARG